MEPLSNFLSFNRAPGQLLGALTAESIWTLSCLGFSLVCTQEMAPHGRLVYAVSHICHLFFSFSSLVFFFISKIVWEVLSHIQISFNSPLVKPVLLKENSQWATGKPPWVTTFRFWWLQTVQKWSLCQPMDRQYCIFQISAAPFPLHRWQSSPRSCLWHFWLCFCVGLHRCALKWICRWLVWMF